MTLSSSSSSDCTLSLPQQTPTVPLIVAGRQVSHLHDVVLKTVEDFCGIEVSRCFCRPLDTAGEFWRTSLGHSEPLLPVTDLQPSQKQIAADKLKHLNDEIRQGRQNLQAQDPENAHFGILSLKYILRIPEARCVFFNGSDLRIIKWGEAPWTEDGPGKFELSDLAVSLKPTPQPDPVQTQPRAFTQRIGDFLSLRMLRGESERRRREQRGLDGEITVTLIWNSNDDLDLSVLCPDGEPIYYGQKNHGNGCLDLDANAGSVTSDQPVENIFFARIPQSGLYRVIVNNYNSRHDGDPGTEFSVILKLPDGVGQVSGLIAHRDDPRTAMEFTVTDEATVETNLSLLKEVTNDA